MKCPVLLTGLLSLSLLLACGGSSTEATSPSSALADVSRLTLLYTVEGPKGATTETAGEALRTALVGKGFSLVTDASAVHDGVLLARVTATPEQSMFQMRVNGQVKTSERVHLTASVQSEGRVVEEAATDFSVSGGQVSEENVSSIATRLGQSQKLVALAHAGDSKRERQAAVSAEQAKASEVQAKDQARVAEENAWTAARVLGCRSPAKLTSCDGVRGYVAQHPDGSHIAEANEALQGAVPALEKLQKDENAWQTAGAEVCRREATLDACRGVEVYRTKYDTGMHVDEAAALLGRAQ